MLSDWFEMLSKICGTITFDAECDAECVDNIIICRKNQTEIVKQFKLKT